MAGGTWLCLYHYRFDKLLISETSKLFSQFHSLSDQLVMVCDLYITEKCVIIIVNAVNMVWLSYIMAMI